jgi:hypothetical protein
MKTYAAWEGSLTRYLQPGDVIDDELVKYLINVVPPITFTSTIVQMGEPYSTNEQGRYTYLTIEKQDGQWTYAGPLPRK